MFGKKIAGLPKAGDEEGLAVARQLLAAANDGATGPKLKAALAMSSLRVSLVLGTEDATALAHTALNTFASAGTLSPVDKAFYLKEIPARRLAKARSEHRNSDELQTIAKTAIEASIAYAQATLGDDNSNIELSGLLQQVRAWTTQYKLKEYASSLDDLQKLSKAASIKRLRLKDALAKLESLKQANNDPQGIRTASKAVGQVYLEVEGNFRSAARYYAGTDDPKGKVVVETIDLLDHPDPLDTKRALDALEGLAKIIDPLNDIAKANASRTALQLAGLYLATDPPEGAAAKTKLAMVQWQSAANAAESEKLKKELSDAYGPIQGKLEVIGEGRVRLSYDFNSYSEIKDWETLSGTWDVGKSMLGAKSTKDHAAIVECRLPFRCDRPFKVTFNGAAHHEMTAKLYVTTWNRKKEPTPDLQDGGRRRAGVLQHGARLVGRQELPPERQAHAGRVVLRGRRDGPLEDQRRKGPHVRAQRRPRPSFRRAFQARARRPRARKNTSRFSIPSPSRVSSSRIPTSSPIPNPTPPSPAASRPPINRATQSPNPPTSPPPTNPSPPGARGRPDEAGKVIAD